MKMNRTVFELIRKNASKERQIDDVSKTDFAALSAAELTASPT